jgi:hypothetical protein
MKTSQIDLTNIIPLQSLGISTYLTVREAKALLSLFAAKKDQYGRTIVPQEIDSMSILGLMDKGMIQSKVSPYLTNSSNVIDFTKNGKDILQRIILSEPSSFDKKSEDDTILIKVAQKKNTLESSWLIRATGL